MISKLLSASHLIRGARTNLVNLRIHSNQANVVSKRWSGHNVMEIKPSNSSWMHVKNWLHFYLLLGIIPLSVLTTIISIRANPELSEVPDGYEPRHWEYFRDPIARFLAKHFFLPVERDHETAMGIYEFDSETKILKKITKRVEKVMRFYNDHRSKYFTPHHADYQRMGRQDSIAGIPFAQTESNLSYDAAYDPDVNPLPTEGFIHGPHDT